MSKEDRIKPIKFLDEKGIFKVKGAANWVAERLKISGSTVYLYLNIARSRENIKIVPRIKEALIGVL